MSRGMDADRYAAVSAAVEAELAAFGATADRLAGRPAEAASRDGRVRVRAIAGGQLTGLRLSEDALARHSAGALGAIVTRTVREAQHRAAEAFGQALSEVRLPAVAEADRILAELEAPGGA